MPDRFAFCYCTCPAKVLHSDENAISIGFKRFTASRVLPEPARPMSIVILLTTTCPHNDLAMVS